MSMDLIEIRKQNPWWEHPSRINEDLKIIEFLSMPIKWNPRLKKYIYLDKNAVYSIRGPRQVGKTTLAKVMIQELLEKSNAMNVMYFACDLLKDNTALSDMLDIYYRWIRTQNKERVHIFLDEISSVKEWQKSVKFFVDMYGNKNITMVVTGSHTLDIKSSAEQLPGRVGEKEHISTHKILLPMKFAEYVKTKNPPLYEQVEAFDLQSTKKRTEEFLEMIDGNIPKSAYNLIRLLPELDTLCDEYLITGGMMTAVNDYEKNSTIDPQIYDMYIRQFIGDIGRIGRDERTAKGILKSVLRKLSTPVSLNSIRQENEIPSHPTVEQYLHILQNMFIVNMFYKIEIDGTIKKVSDKKIHILNTFIFHALNGWLMEPAKNPYQLSLSFLFDSESKSKLVESVVGDHLNRAAYTLRPTDTFDALDHVFYMKTKKGHEIDYIITTERGIRAVDVLYQNKINSEDFRALHILKRGCMITKKTLAQRENISLVPLSLFLLYI